MQFALLIYGDEAMGNERYAGLSQEEAAAEMGKWFAYTEELKSSGVHVAGEERRGSRKPSPLPPGLPVLGSLPEAVWRRGYEVPVEVTFAHWLSAQHHNCRGAKRPHE